MYHGALDNLDGLYVLRLDFKNALDNTYIMLIVTVLIKSWCLRVSICRIENIDTLYTGKKCFKTAKYLSTMVLIMNTRIF